MFSHAPHSFGSRKDWVNVIKYVGPQSSLCVALIERLCFHVCQAFKDLLYGHDERNIHFRENIQLYNMMFSFISMGGKIDSRINNGKSAPIFILHEENYHSIGSLLPVEGSTPKFA